MIRLRGPRVRPLVRFSLKRVLRTLPSALLLLLVLSLVFVTLMQIAVIHAHRRTPKAAQESPQNTSSKQPAEGGPVLGVANLPLAHQGTGRPPHSHGHRRPDALRVEAYLDKSAPTVDANAQIFANLVAANRVRRVIDLVGGVPEGPRTGRVRVLRRTEHKSRRRKDACPPVPPDIEGRLKADVSPRSMASVERAMRGTAYARGGPGGVWRPPGCAARHRVAVVVPYRDRASHLATLLAALHPLLQRQQLEYAVFVVEQWGNETFNKGVLMNAGVREAVRGGGGDFACFVFHDVDLIPEDDRILYSCPPQPRHLSVAVDKFNYTLPYSLLVGGVFSIRLEHFLLVNGYSNLYWGWGGEDDDMGYRIKFRKLEILRLPEAISRYSMIKHDHRPESPNAIRSALLRMAKKRSSRDGLTTAKYRLLWRREMPAYTHLMVDIGNNHKWQFLDGRRLVINF